jgi:hypothetical protein
MDKETETTINRLLADNKAARDLNDYLIKENKRLREALKQIEYLDRPQNRGLPRRVSIHEIALAALKEGE